MKAAQDYAAPPGGQMENMEDPPPASQLPWSSPESSHVKNSPTRVKLDIQPGNTYADLEAC